jgi:putative restriction endonuclease
MVHGHLAHVPVGTYFTDRRSLYTASVHRDIRREICGSGIAGRGAESVVLSGGCEDDVDLGAVIYYTGQGGRDRSGQQVHDQAMEGLNASLSRNVDTADPVRVIRMTPAGLRYDGLYEVQDAWLGPGKRGFQVCHFRLAQLDVADASVLGSRPTQASIACGRSGPVARRETTHYRLKRDGRVPSLVKELYDYTCQVCGVRLNTVVGAYAEGAHLVPLAGDGDDHTSNVLCLCPNHHVMLDHGAMAFTDDFRVILRDGTVLGALHVLPEHGLSSTHAATHRRTMGFE